MKKRPAFLIPAVLAAFTLTAQALDPPELAPGTVTDTSIIVEWGGVALADGYVFDASASPTFTTEKILHYASVNANNSTELNGWTSTSTSANGLVLLNGITTANIALSPLIDLTTFNDAVFTFTARMHGGSAHALALVRVQITTDGGTSWVTVGEATPTTATQEPFSMSLKTWCGHVVQIRMFAPLSNGTQGASAKEPCFKAIVPDFLPNYENIAINETSVSVTGLDPDTTYYFRASAPTFPKHPFIPLFYP